MNHVLICFFVPVCVRWSEQLELSLIKLLCVRACVCECRDFRLLNQMGCNTIRLWTWNEGIDHTPFLDEAFKHGIHVIIPFDPSFGSVEYQFDITDDRESVWGEIEARFRKVVHRYQVFFSFVIFFVY